MCVPLKRGTIGGLLKKQNDLLAMKEEHKFIPYGIHLTTKARENRCNQTFPEKMVWLVLLRDREFEGLKFIRQKPVD